MRIRLLLILSAFVVLSGCGGGGGGGSSSDSGDSDSPAAVTASTPLNDTGIDWFADAITNFLVAEPVAYPGQDATYGRDAAVLVKTGGGVAGFDFTKLDAAGAPLADQSAVYAATPWACVRDNVTGLVWEVKTDDGGLRDKDWIYTWYNSDATVNGGSVGTSDGGTCAGGIDCDTAAYVAAVNAAGLGGYSDWRMPTVAELISIVDYGADPTPAIDTDYFANVINGGFWTGSPSAVNIALAWGVNFSTGLETGGAKSSGGYVRLVRD